MSGFMAPQPLVQVIQYFTDSIIIYIAHYSLNYRMIDGKMTHIPHKNPSVLLFQQYFLRRSFNSHSILNRTSDSRSV